VSKNVERWTSKPQKKCGAIAAYFVLGVLTIVYGSDPLDVPEDDVIVVGQFFFSLLIGIITAEMYKVLLKYMNYYILPTYLRLDDWFLLIIYLALTLVWGIETWAGKDIDLGLGLGLFGFFTYSLTVFSRRFFGREIWARNR
jgi:hypothetical protein